MFYVSIIERIEFLFNPENCMDGSFSWPYSDVTRHNGGFFEKLQNWSSKQENERSAQRTSTP